MGANPNIVDREIHLSIFEKCCQTPNYGNFIKECIDYGCDVNQACYKILSNKLYQFITKVLYILFLFI